MSSTSPHVQTAQRFILNEMIYYLVKENNTPQATPYVTPVEVDGNFIPVIHFWSNEDLALAATEREAECYATLPIKLKTVSQFLTALNPPWIVMFDLPDLSLPFKETLQFSFGPQEFAIASGHNSNKPSRPLGPPGLN